MKDLKTTLYLTVHGSKLSVPEIADRLGISASYLYRCCLEGESGVRFPIELLLPLMQATNDYRLLEHLNARAGRISVRLPRVRRLKLRDPRAVNQIQQHFNAVMAAVLKFFDDPDPELLPEVEGGLHEHMCETAALKKAVRDFRQRDLIQNEEDD